MKLAGQMIIFGLGSQRSTKMTGPNKGSVSEQWECRAYRQGKIPRMMIIPIGTEADHGTKDSFHRFSSRFLSQLYRHWQIITGVSSIERSVVDSPRAGGRPAT